MKRYSLSNSSRLYFSGSNLFITGLLLIVLTAISNSSFAATRTTVASGNWSSAATWQSGVIPASTDDIIIGNGFTLTVDANKTCNSISFSASNSTTATGTLFVNTGIVLTITGALSTTNPTTTTVKTSGNYTLSGNGQINCATLNCNNNASPSGSTSTNITLISSISNLTVGNVNITSTYTNTGSKSNNGKLNIQAGTVTVNGTIYTINTDPANISTIDLVTSANNPSLILNGATPLTLSATGTNNISFNGTGATVNYSYGGSQSVYSTPYTNLTLSGAGTKTAAGALTVGGNFTIGTGSTFAAGSYVHTISGNWSNSGTFIAGTSNVYLNGSVPQIISGSTSTTFNNLTLNNASGLLISTSTEIDGLLAFAVGKITTGANKVTLGSAAITTGAGSGAYINGNEEIFISSAIAPTKTFNIGDNSNYTPLTVAFSGTTIGSGSLTASTQAGDNADIANSGIDGTQSVNRNWTLVNNGISGFTSYAATFNFVSTDPDASANSASFVVRLLNGSTWSTTNLVSANALSTQANGMTTFGTYQVGTPSAAPVVSTNPVATAICSTNGTSFTATATSAPLAVITWQRDPNTGIFADITSLTDGGVYSNYNGTTLNISSTAGLSGYKYRAVFTSINGSAISSSATLSVTTASSATFSYGATSFCNSGSAAVNLTGGTAGGTFSSTTGLSINATTGLINLAASTAGSYVVTYSFAATGACPVIQNNANITVNQLGAWTGGVSTTWNLAANWQCGVIPTSTTDVTIPSGLSNYPIITVGVTAMANNLSIQTGASITVSNGSLQIAGAATTAGGKIDATSGKVEFNGSTQQIIPVSLFNLNIVKDLVITNPAGVLLNAAVRVTNSVGFGNVNNSVLNSNSFLTLVSTSSNTANVLDITNGGVNRGNQIIGNVTVERYAQGRRAFRFLTAPVNSTTSIRGNWMENTNNPSTSVNNNPAPGYGTHITGTGGNSNGFDVTNTNNPSFYTFNNATQTWIAAPNTAGLFTPGNAYRILIRGSRSVDLNNNAATSSVTTLRATGTLVTGPVVFAATGGTPGLPALSNVVGSYSFIANPYASSVNWESLITTATDISPSMYIFDPTITGSNGRGGYVSYNAILKANNILSSLISKDIQSGQALFVQATGPNPSITFNENNKSNSFLPVFRTADVLPHLAVQLLLPEQVGTESVADGTAVYFSDDFNSSICGDDSYKFTNLDENIAILRNGTTLSIEGRKPAAANDSIPLKTWQLTKTSYVLKISMENFTDNVQGFIKDKFLNTSTPLVGGENSIPYNITSDAASSASDRFTIVFKTSSTLPVNLSNIKAYAKNKGVQIDWVAQNESNINVYEIERSTDAQKFVTIGSAGAKNNPAIAANYSFLDVNPNNGDNYYRIKTIDKSGSAKFSEVVRVQLGNAKNSISVLNNPIEGSTIKLVFDNIVAGTYMVNLMNASGEKVYTGKISFGGGNNIEQIELNSRLSAGVYELQITNGTYNKTMSVLVN